MSMARLWRDQGRPDEARELLAPVYGSIGADGRRGTIWLSSLSASAR